MGINKEKIRKALRKTARGIQLGYKASSKFIKEVGPPVHNYLKNMAEGATEAFEIEKPRHRVSFKVRPIKRFPRMIINKKPRVRVSRADFNNLGMRY